MEMERTERKAFYLQGGTVVTWYSVCSSKAVHMVILSSCYLVCQYFRDDHFFLWRWLRLPIFQYALATPLYAFPLW
jgi:hypothetical protein